MTFMERINEARTMWTAMMPGVALPPQETFARWVGRFSSDELLFGISKTAAAAKRGDVSADRLPRYCTGIMMNVQRDKKTRTEAGPCWGAFQFMTLEAYGVWTVLLEQPNRYPGIAITPVFLSVQFAETSEKMVQTQLDVLTGEGWAVRTGTSYRAVTFEQWRRMHPKEYEARLLQASEATA